MNILPDPQRRFAPGSEFALKTLRQADGSESLNARIRRHRHPLTSFLASLLAHVILLLALLLMVYSLPQPTPRISVLSSIDAQTILETPHDIKLNSVQIELPTDTQSPIDLTANDLSRENEIQIAESPNTIFNSITNNNTPSAAETETPVAPQQTLPTGGGLAGRDANARSRLAATRGGSPASEMAVEAGLRWILAHQRADGSWRFHHDDGNCQGDCRNEGARESTTAATGLSLLALLGAGYTHRSGPHQEAIQKGLDYLLEKIRYTPHGGILAEGQDGMYAQAIATMALAEAYTMTRDTNLLSAIDEARKYIVKAQHRGGSWGYNAGSPGDTTLTGWQLMALKSCQLAGFPTPPKTWQLAEKFIDSMSSSTGSFGYRTPAGVTPATTSVGLLSKMYLGMPKEHRMLADGGDLIFEKGPSRTDVYFDYYATMVLHHRGGPTWKQWNIEMRDFLIASQTQRPGHARGSWYFEDPHGVVGGRLYTTAMAVMILEVYYRYLPLYDDQAVEAEFIAPMLR